MLLAKERNPEQMRVANSNIGFVMPVYLCDVQLRTTI